MSNSDNDLKLYIEEKLKINFNKTITVKETDKSKIYVFEHKETGKKIIERVSSNRNDCVFKTLMDVENDNLVNVLEVCNDENSLIILEDYVEGTNLFDLLQKGNLNRNTALKYTLDICNAIIALHKKGIVHRDIKPGNVIITKNNTAVLIDFSIARKISSNDESDTENLGTLGYAAPEQYGITQSNKTTDIYSLGVLLNIMLTGEHPAVAIPKGIISRIIGKATSTQISKRYQSAAQMKKDILLLSYF